MRVPLAYLREIGLVSATELLRSGPVEELLADSPGVPGERAGPDGGHDPRTTSVARGCSWRIASRGSAGLSSSGSSAADVSGFLARECPRRSVSGARDLAARLRQLLRYLHVVGVDRGAAGVGGAAGRGSPRPVAAEGGRARGDHGAVGARAILELAIGRRDFAVLLLLSRLGLRAGEVAAIGLDDVDWRAGELLVHGKGHREDTMPLPVDVGEALVAYLRVRPASEHRALFLCAQAPFGPVSSHVVAMIVRRACRRARIPEVGPHSLRHTAATEMLRARARLRRSRRCCATVSCNRPRSTPASTWTRCERSRCRGQEAGHERSVAASARGLSDDPPAARLSAAAAAAGCWQGSCGSSSRPALERSRPSSRSRGPGSRRVSRRFAGVSGSGWSAGSPAIWRRSTRRPRSHPPMCCPLVSSASRRISTRLRRSTR